MWPVIVGGLFTVGGVLVGHVLAGRGETRRLAADDERRWLNDRRGVYARYLDLCEDLLREIDRVAVVHLSHDGQHQLHEAERTELRRDLFDYFQRWEDDLQPVLSEVQLMASPAVADLADRGSGALMDITGVVESIGTFTEYYPGWFQARDLIQVLRNAMRAELGLDPLEIGAPQRDPGWPWLDDRPPRAFYRQGHGRGDAL